MSIAGDIGDPATAQRVISEGVARFGRIDTLVNNAGTYIGKPFTEHIAEDYAAVMKGSAKNEDQPATSARRPHAAAGRPSEFQEHSMQSVEIKAIGNNDFDIWLPLWKGYQRFYEVGIPESVTLKTWARFLDPVETMHAALAIVGEQAVGLVHSIYHRSAWATSDDCYLQDLFVAADGRDSGVGRALIEHVYADARRRGASRVYWLTHESNHGARQLYDRIADRWVSSTTENCSGRPKIDPPRDDQAARERTDRLRLRRRCAHDAGQDGGPHAGDTLRQIRIDGPPAMQSAMRWPGSRARCSK